MIRLGRGWLRLAIAAIVLGLVLPADAYAIFTGLPTGFVDQPFLTVPSPTAIDWLPDGRILVTSKSGEISRADANGQNQIQLTKEPPLDVCSDGERGLLGLAVDPEFAQSGHLFVYYTHPNPGGGCANRVSRLTLAGDDLSDERILIDNIASPAPNHNAGDVQIGRDGLVYISVGDGGAEIGNPTQTQDRNGNARRLDILNGKILRIEQNGGIPAGNPFTGDGTRRCSGVSILERAARGVHAEKHNRKHKKKQRKRKKRRDRPGPICQEIFATGLRNPFRIAFDPDDTTGAQTLYINDVGGGVFEEIDEAVPGADYGWNVREGPCARDSTNCTPDDRFVDPIFSYRHGNSNPPFDACAGTAGRRSITGGAFVPDDADWPAAFVDAYLFADFVCDKLFTLDEDGSGFSAAEFGRGSGAIHLAFGPDGALYYTTFDGGGQVRRIVPPPPE
jgi:glucose/arabinose dehydrogenase